MWSTSPNAPPILRYEHILEKATFAGGFISSILYGVLTVVFFQCMAALLDPAHRRGEGIKWWLVSHTMAMFSFVTVYTAMSLHIQSISFIDHAGQVGYSEPLEFQLHLRESARGLIPNVMFNLNNWLADGLLVSVYFPVIPQFGIPYLSLSVSLNVLLTLMIVIRLVLYGRNVRAATGSRAGISGLYKVISTMLIESCALFTMSSLAVVAPLVPVRVENVRNLTTYYSRSYVVDIFFPILAEIQVTAPLLIVQRVANRSALTSHTFTTGHTGSFNVRSRGEMTCNDYTSLGGYFTRSVGESGENPGEPGVVVGDLFPSGP